MVLIALALRMAVIPFDTIENLMDANHIHAWEPGNVAESILAGHGFGSSFLSNQLAASFPPVYPYIVVAFFYVFGIHTAQSIFAIHTFDCLLSALACIPIFLFTRNTFGPRVAKWVAWTWVFFPYAIYFSAAWAWSTNILLFCLCWLIYLAQKLEKSSSLGLWAGFGLLAGFTGLDEPSVFVVTSFMMAFAILRLILAKKRWFMQGLVASLVLVATITPWLIRDEVVFHRFIPIRGNMGLEMYMGNNGQNLRWTSDDLNPLHNQQELDEYTRVGEVAYMDHKAAQAHAYIAAHRGWYVKMCIRRAVYMWTGFWSFNPAYLSEEPMDPYNIPFATCFTLTGLVGLFFLWRRQRFEAIRYAGILLLFPMMYYLAHPEPYHLRPLDPIMVMLSCYAFFVVREKMKNKKANAALATN